MNMSELGWKLHKLAINPVLDRPTRVAIAEAARKLHDIARLSRPTLAPQETLANIKRVIEQ
jgi:hypothetical protein